MKAAYIYEHGNSDKIEIGNLDIPKIGCNDVLIKIKYAALNHIDLFVVKGWSGLNLSFPHVLGSDGSGVVENVGSCVTKFKEGNRVAINPGISCGKCFHCLSGQQNFCSEFSILGENQWGTFSEFLRIPEINLIKVPDDFALEKAGAAPLTFLTAWRMLNTLAKTKREEFVFIHGAGGGVASAAIQIAKYLGATIITTTSTEEKMEKAKENGADFVFNYKQNNNYSKQVYKEITNKKGVDVVIDTVGKETFPTSVRLLKPGGRLITCGATTGPNSELDLRYIFWKQLKIKGSTMSNQKEFREVMNLLFDGKIRPIIDKIYSFEKVQEAEEYLNRGNQFGKILLKI